MAEGRELSSPSFPRLRGNSREIYLENVMEPNSLGRGCDLLASNTDDVRYRESEVAVEHVELRCYQCMQVVAYLFDDSRCKRCTRVEPEQV